MEIIIKVNLKMVKKGKSKYVYQDGWLYEGEFKNDEFEGQGLYVDEDG
jgi:hypothetical protein